MHRILLLITITAMMFAISALSADMVFNVQISDPVIFNNRFETEKPKIMNPGEPIIPYKSMQILLPQGTIVTETNIEIDHTSLTVAGLIEHAQEPVPISKRDLAPQFTFPNPEIYESNKFYPYKDMEVSSVARKKGYDILFVSIYPYRYNPVTQELKWATEFTLTVKTEYDEETAYQQNLFLMDNDSVKKEISELVINAETVRQYRKEHVRTDPILPDPNNPYRMIIISCETKEQIFTEFIKWKDSQGISTGFFTVQDIYANYEGRDRQEQIRNLIIDAYQSYSGTQTPLEYVILGGDDNIIPIRGMYGRVGNYIDHNMPSDIYYSNLDGDWDANGNNIFGEPADNVDWFAEVALGRIPANTDTQFRNFFDKTYYYVDTNSYSNDIAYMLGENLDRTPTWGGDYKDEIIPYLPDGFEVTTLYERDDTFSSQAVVNAINNGLGIINHIGHSHYYIVFGLNNLRIANLRNTEFGFAYTQGCYPAAFDEFTSDASGCVGQNLTTATGGLFAFIGNTRYGWYRRGTTDGPSQAFDRTFFSGLFDHDIRELGHTMNYSKEALVNQAMNQSVMRWIYYQLVLFGDPSVEVKEPLGTFPYIEPVDVVFDDSEGDNDGMVNPGETIQIFLEVTNLENWSDADETFGKISTDSEYIKIINDTAYFGYIPTNDSVKNINAPFIISLDENIPYQTYNIQLRLSAVGDNDAYFARNYSIPMNVTLIQKHWPRSFEIPISAAPAVYDLDGDGDKQIIISDIQGTVHFLNSDTTLYSEPVKNEEIIWRSTAYADITGNGELDIVVTSRRNKIAAYSHLGDTLFTFTDTDQIVLTPAVADLNNDGSKQVIALDIYNNLYVVNNMGHLQEGFPLKLSQTAVADMAAADITGDGYKEIIVGLLDGMLHVIRYDGTYIDNFPINLGDQIIAAPIVLHNFDIVTATREKLYLISRDGEILFARNTPGRVSMEVIAADFTGSNSLEFAYVTNNGRVDIVDRNGDSLPGFPFNTYRSFLYPPLAADMNNDGRIDLICYTGNGEIYGFNADGTMINALPFPANISITSPATIADIDGDGDLEIIVATSTGITVIDYKYPYGKDKVWTTYRNNLQRTGFYGLDETLSAEEVIPQIETALHGNYPNPFNPATTIDFSLKAPGRVKIDVFNIRGQLVETLIDDELAKGHHSVSWNGTDNRNQPVSSGVYFYRMTAEDKLLTRKMMLLK